MTDHTTLGQEITPEEIIVGHLGGRGAKGRTGSRTLIFKGRLGKPDRPFCWKKSAYNLFTRTFSYLILNSPFLQII